jgi:heat shock protein HtpX
MKTNIYKNQTGNVLKTWIFLILFTLLVGFVGFLLASYFNNPLFFYLGSFVSVGISIWSYWFSSSLVLRMANAKQLGKDENPELEAMVRSLSIQAGLPMPKIYIVSDPSPNAFATGRNPANGVVAFTTGILSLLNKEELEGVTAHELAHIANRDTLIMTVVSVLANIIQSLAHYMYFFSGSRDNNSSNAFLSILASIAIAILAPLAAVIIQLAISRSREFLADASGVAITKYPQGLANALRKIHEFPQGMQSVNPSISHLFISDPEKDTVEHHSPWYMKLFMTHPPLSERIEAIMQNR